MAKKGKASTKKSARGKSARPQPHRRDEMNRKKVIDVPSRPVKDKAEEENGEEKHTTLLDQFGESLLQLGGEARRLGKLGLEKAEKYGKIGWHRAELEKERIALQYAYGKLGERIVDLWDDSPKASVRRSDREIAGEVEKVAKHRERMAELREAINSLRAEEEKK